jgi:hypothetical protein
MRAAAIAVGLAGLLVSGCDRTTEMAMGDAIEIGPYTFSVTSAERGRAWESAEGTYREIVVRIRVHRDDAAPFTDSFSSSFIDSMAIVDAAGNTVRTGPAPVSPVYKGGRYRSEYYQCVFRYSRSSEGVRDFARIGTRPQDFKLLITNAAREGEQPRRIAIQLG